MGRARTRRLGVGAGIAGLVAAVLFGGSVALGRGGGCDSTRGDGSRPQPTVPENVPSTTVPPTTTLAPDTVERVPATTTARASTSTTRTFAEPASGQQAVTAFTAAVDRADATPAWRLLSSRSQAFWKTKASFRGVDQ